MSTVEMLVESGAEAEAKDLMKDLTAEAWSTTGESEGQKMKNRKSQQIVVIYGDPELMTSYQQGLTQ